LARADSGTEGIPDDAAEVTDGTALTDRTAHGPYSSRTAPLTDRTASMETRERGMRTTTAGARFPTTGPPPTLPWARWLPLSARAGVAAEARAFTADFLAGVPDPFVVADAVLVVSELVGNALRHAGEPGALLLVRGPGRVRSEVSDSSPRPPLPRPPHGPDERGGLGLYLLDRLALRWGWRPLGPGKTVWCELRLPEG
jgi:anti-sigma regulatory factor (Ser/Thr protein kinase)